MSRHGSTPAKTTSLFAFFSRNSVAPRPRVIGLIVRGPRPRSSVWSALSTLRSFDASALSTDTRRRGMILDVRTERAAIEEWLVLSLPTTLFFKCRWESSSAELNDKTSNFFCAISRLQHLPPSQGKMRRRAPDLHALSQSKPQLRVGSACQARA